MIWDLSDTGGLIRLGPFALFWQNADGEYPGFTALSWSNYNLEFGEIDAGNGIHLTKFADGDIEYVKTLVKV